MFEGLYNKTCKIWRRETGGDTPVKDGSKAADEYYLFIADEPCKFLPKIGKSIPNEGTGRDVIIDGEFRMNTELLATDKIEYDGYDYVVSEVQPKKDIVTDIVRYYRATVVRQRKSNEQPVTVI